MLSMSMTSILKLMIGANFPPIVVGNMPAKSGFPLELLKVKPQSLLGWLSGLLQMSSKGHHHQAMVPSYVCFRKAHCHVDVNS